MLIQSHLTFCVIYLGCMCLCQCLYANGIVVWGTQEKTFDFNVCIMIIGGMYEYIKYNAKHCIFGRRFSRILITAKACEIGRYGARRKKNGKEVRLQICSTDDDNLNIYHTDNIST